MPEARSMVKLKEIPDGSIPKLQEHSSVHSVKFYSAIAFENRFAKMGCSHVFLGEGEPLPNQPYTPVNTLLKINFSAYFFAQIKSLIPYLSSILNQFLSTNFPSHLLFLLFLEIYPYSLFT